MRIIFLLTFIIFSGCEKTPEKISESLWYPNKTETNSVVIFVHGVMGDSIETWRPSSSSQGWPQLLTSDDDMPNVDVLSVGYRSKPLERSQNIEELSNSIMQALQDRSVFKKYDNVIFVVHSMGGLITKRFLVTLRAENIEQFNKVKGIIFFSTPSGGADIARVASWLSSNEQFGDMEPSDFNSSLQILDNDWKRLLRLRTSESPFPKSFCAYETLSTSTLKVVPRSTSEQGCDNTPLAFDRDHLSIVKPFSKDDDLHIFLRARIQDIIETTTEAQQSNLENPLINLTCGIEPPDEDSDLAKLFDFAEHNRGKLVHVEIEYMPGDCNCQSNYKPLEFLSHVCPRSTSGRLANYHCVTALGLAGQGAGFGSFCFPSYNLLPIKPGYFGEEKATYEYVAGEFILNWQWSLGAPHLRLLLPE